MKQYEFLPLGVVNEPYRQAIQSKIDSVLDKGWYLNGEFGKQVEAQLSSLTKMPWAVACSNGLDALRLIFRGYKELGVMRDGDEVIVQANTYIASVLAISDNGLRPVLVDADIDTMVDLGNLPEFATPGDFSYSGEVWVIAHHVAHGSDGILPLCKCHQFPALADIFGHRLFQQQVEAGFKYFS